MTEKALTVGHDGGAVGPPTAGGGAAISSSLDPHETSARDAEGLILHWQEDIHPDLQWERLTLHEARIRHSGWAAARKRVWDAMCRTRQSANRRVRFAECGSAAWVQWSPSRCKHRLTCNSCKDRWCRPCQHWRATQIRHQLRKLQPPVRFLTLTLRSNSLSLKEQTDRLYASFRQLRRDKWFAEHVRGGIAILEVKLTKSGRWHPHLHCLTVGQYIDQRQLSRKWLAITGDSSIVDVRLVRSMAEVQAYVAKYLTKPTSADVLRNPDLLDEALVALKGRRMVLPWGIAREWIKDDDEDDDGLDDWISICPLAGLLRDAAAGNTWAITLLHNLTPLKPQGQPP